MSQVKNELALHLEQLREEYASYHQTFIASSEEVDEALAAMGMDAKRESMPMNELIAQVIGNIIKQICGMVYEGVKEGKFELKLKEALEYAEKILPELLKLAGKFRKKKV